MGIVGRGKNSRVSDPKLWFRGQSGPAPLAAGGPGGGSGSNFVVATGLWDDDGIWLDTENWKDA